MEFFRNLGDNIERRWARHHYSHAAFADLATEILESNRPSNHVSGIDIIRWVHESANLPPQKHLKDSFGDPPVCVYSGSEFYIEVLFWLDGHTSIHEHGFSGAFHVLQGSSIQAEYDFHERRKYSEYVSTGDVVRKGERHLHRGDVTTIYAGRPTIHSVYHLDRPTISVVLRTYGDPGAAPQQEFHRSGLAVDLEYKTTKAKKRVRTLKMLKRSESPFFEEMATLFLRDADALSACKFVEEVEPELTIPELEGLLRPHLDPDLASTLLATARHWRRDRWLRPLAHGADADRRHFLGLLLTIGDREGMLKLLAERYPGKDVAKLLVDWMTSLDVPDADAAPTMDETTRVVLRHILEGSSKEGLLERLADDFDPADVRELAPELHQLESAIRSSSLYGPLCPRSRHVAGLAASSI
jgi:hypothetical protein